MPAKSPAALERKRLQRLAKDQAKAAAKRTARPVVSELQWPTRKISARRMMPKLPEMKKSELRAMLTQIVQNTAAL